MIARTINVAGKKLSETAARLRDLAPSGLPPDARRAIVFLLSPVSARAGRACTTPPANAHKDRLIAQRCKCRGKARTQAGGVGKPQPAAG
jgi:hypothetical protein